METKELVPNEPAVEAELEPLMDVRDVARILKIAPKTVHKRVREGKLGCVEVSEKDRRFSRDQVQDYIKSQTREPRIDKRKGRAVRSAPPKGGEKSSRVFDRANLLKEMRSWR